MRRLIGIALAIVLPLASPGGTNDVDRTDPNFVTASLMVAGPGGALFSCVGHAFIRLECPTFKLDYCFSYESEDVSGRVFGFLSGKLKMGMYAIPTAEYLKTYREEGRSVTQYVLELPPDVKQRFWKIMDDKVTEGIELPYDFENRGCARAIVVNLKEALKPLQMEQPRLPDIYGKTRRELTARALSRFHWTRFALHSVCGVAADRDLRNAEKVVMPADLLEFLKGARVNGRPVLSKKGEPILSSGCQIGESMFTPMMMSWLLVGLSLAGWFVRGRWLTGWVDGFLLGTQSVSGFYMTYMVFLSRLPTTGWNWLIVPFNLLPLVFWRWRRYWAWGFVAILLVWEAFMLLSPHQLTDPAYLVIVFAYVIFYVKMARTPVTKFL